MVNVSVFKVRYQIIRRVTLLANTAQKMAAVIAVVTCVIDQ